MLSIGKVGLSRSQQLYYEQQVARGAEDYYAGRGEAPGRWAGRGAELLGLEGDLDPDQLTALMDGKHPAAGDLLANRSARSSTAGFDLTFSAPKSVSVLFAIGDDGLATALVDAHEEAVEAALGYLEHEACRVRRGHGGMRKEPAAGFVAAAYQHRMSRAQDPQLHTHVVVANMARGADGRWTALDGRPIFEHAKAAGFLYEAHLRRAVVERLPWASWGMVRQGIAELEQVPEDVREEFSQRRQRILERERELDAAGVAVGPAGRERIVFDTREPKRQVIEADWQAEIRARAAEHGLSRERLELLEVLSARSEHSPGLPVEALPEAALAERLFAPTGLTASRNTFAERDVLMALAEAHQHGASTEALIGLAGRMLDQSEVVQLGSGRDRRYTTRELLRAEEVIVGHAQAGMGTGAAVLDERRLGIALETLACRLTDEQAGVVAGIAVSGNRIDVVEALAGTGKTTSAAALREVYERAGYRVIGAAPNPLDDLLSAAGRAVGQQQRELIPAIAGEGGGDPHCRALSSCDDAQQGVAGRVPSESVNCASRDRLAPLVAASPRSRSPNRTLTFHARCATRVASGPTGRCRGWRSRAATTVERSPVGKGESMACVRLAVQPVCAVGGAHGLFLRAPQATRAVVRVCARQG